jgi:CheY-like chemotaxis protein
MVAEDDQALSLFLQKGLELEGHAVECIADGATAVEKIRDDAPDLLVLDLGLPQLDGVDVLRALVDQVPGMSILVLSGRAQLPQKIECLNLGADDYLFSGSSTAQPFTQQSDGTVTYNGNAQTTSVALAGGGALQSSLPGSSVFTATSASVFGTLNDLITGLNGTGTLDSATLVGNLTDALTNVSSQRAVLNTAQNRLSSESDYVTTQKTNLSAQQSALLTADPAALATELSAVTTQQNALMSTIGIVQKGSLFDYL